MKDGEVCELGLNPSLAGTTSPTSNNVAINFIRCVLILLLLEQPLRLSLSQFKAQRNISLNPSLAGTTSPTYYYDCYGHSYPVLILLLLEQPLRHTCPEAVVHFYSLNPSLAGTTSPTYDSRSENWQESES